jgi:hypothetical protein
MVKRRGKRTRDKCQLRRRFEESGAGTKYARREKRRPLPINSIANWLLEIFKATRDPAFYEAFRLLPVYDLAGPNLGKRLQAISTQLDCAEAIPMVEEARQRQSSQQDRFNLKAACERAALEVGVEAPSLDAASKRVERAYRDHQKGRIHTGDSGDKLIVASIKRFPDSNEPCFFKTLSPSGNANWVVEVEAIGSIPADRDARRALAHESLVVLKTIGREERTPSRSLKAPAQLPILRLLGR